MREKVGDPKFLARKKVEAALAKAAPELVTPSYTMVTFRPHLPYHEALARSRAQDRILDELVADAALVAACQTDPSESALVARLREAARGLSR
jgi:kynurenine 3-monooxygenase